MYPDGTDARTSVPAPILAKSPMSTLPNAVAPAASSTPRPIRGAPKALDYWVAALIGGRVTVMRMTWAGCHVLQPAGVRTPRASRALPIAANVVTPDR